MTSLLDAVGPQGLRVLDGFVTFWVVLWIALGILTGDQVRQLTSISDAAEASAVAADRAGEALQSLQDLPLVGEDAGQLGSQVRDASRDVLAEAGDTRGTLSRLGVLLGISIALIPLTPVLWLYLPPRLAHRADVVELRRRLGAGPLDDALSAYLARRAVDRLPYRRLQALTDDPAGDLRDGRHDVLARAELDRLGLTAAR